MLSGTRGSHMSVYTGLPERACRVVGVMKRQAASVMTTRTSAPALTNRRVSSAALYAAIPPVSPSRIFLPETSVIARQERSVKPQTGILSEFHGDYRLAPSGTPARAAARAGRR